MDTYANPRIWMDIAADGKPLGRIILELNQEKAPKTVANFLALSTGSHRLIKGKGTGLFKPCPVKS